MKSSRTYILISLVFFSTLRTMAQGNFSPYSQMGIGDLEDSYYNRTSGMANTGVAYRNNRYIINNNPAALSALSDQFFTVEMGIRGSLINYYGTPVDPASTQSGDITFRRFAMAMKLSKHWGSSIGLVPFSTQNYEYDVPYYLQGSPNELANHHYQGHGSVNKAYWANSYEFFHHLSIGVEAGYLFGQLNQKDNLQNVGTGSTLASTTNTVDLNNLYMQYGLQLYGRLGKKWEYSLGGTFNQRSDLLASTTRVVLDNDSIQRNIQELSQGYLSVPNAFGLGLAITHNQKYTFLADYKYQDWAAERNNYPGKNYTVTNSNRGSVGFEISRKKSFYNSKIELSYAQLGAYYGETYLQVNGKQIKDYGVTASFGVNGLKALPLSYNIILQYGIKGTQQNNLVEQRYVNLTFVVNYGAIWFTRGKKYD